MDALLKGSLGLLSVLIAVIAVAFFARDPRANSESARPAMSGALTTTCPLSTVQTLLDSNQLSAVKTKRSPQCLEIGVADKLWMTMDQKDRQGLVLAVECAVSADDKRMSCLKLYSQSSGRLFGSAEMGRVTIEALN
jgi:hypothetical protein